MRGAGGAVGGGRLAPPRRHSSDERAGTLRKLATKLRAVMLPKRNLVAAQATTVAADMASYGTMTRM